jgi:two-component system, NarL family, response regulator NreC
MGLKQKTKVLLADDHRLLRAGLKLLLQRKSYIEVVGEASDGIQTLKLFDMLKPDILILDLSMPNMDGIECLKEIKSRDPKAKVIVLTMHEDKNYIQEVMRAGASAYVQKGAVDTELFEAIKTVQTGEIYLSQEDSKALLSALLKKVPQVPDEQNPFVLLSPREREVLKLLARGYSLTEIAYALSLSIKTVDTYKVRVMDKIHANKKSELVNYALKYGILMSEHEKEM